MIKAAITTAMAVTLLSAATPAKAWGAKGHEVVAAIAFSHLTPAEQARTTALLRAARRGSFVSAASWADFYRKDHLESGAWHFVNIPLGAPGFQAGRDCRTGTEPCAITKIEELVGVLAGPQSDAAKGTALALLIHLIGDLHSPMHASDNGDHGGNGVRVLWRGQQLFDYGEPLNLHHAWDDELVAAAVGDKVDRAADLLDAAATPAHRTAWCSGTLADWANEAHQIAQTVAYGKLRQANLDDAYITDAVQAVDLQLERAGVRLACVIHTNLR